MRNGRELVLSYIGLVSLPISPGKTRDTTDENSTSVFDQSIGPFVYNLDRQIIRDAVIDLCANTNPWTDCVASVESFIYLEDDSRNVEEPAARFSFLEDSLRSAQLVQLKSFASTDHSIKKVFHSRSLEAPFSSIFFFSLFSTWFYVELVSSRTVAICGNPN